MVEQAAHRYRDSWRLHHVFSGHGASSISYQRWQPFGFNGLSGAHALFEFGLRGIDLAIGASMTALLVIVGGALGAPTRYLVETWIEQRHQLRFPLGTLLINWSGSLALGLVSGISTSWASLVSVGFLGAFTTWSTFIVEAVRLGKRGWLSSSGYVLASIVGGVILAFFGHQLSA